MLFGSSFPGLDPLEDSPEVARALIITYEEAFAEFILTPGRKALVSG
jgi:hypothetical protein